MSFRDNLQHLRATRNMTQEQLAMLLGVSRQSVTKWEAEKSYPEMDKLLKICQIFECSLDDLVQGDLTGRPVAPIAASVPVGPPADVCGYDEHMRRFAWQVSVGVGIIILGVAGTIVLDVLMHTVWASVACLFVGVLAGVGLFVVGGLEHSAFAKAHPYVEDFYTADEKASARRLFSVCLVLGLGLIFLGIVLATALGDTQEDAAGALMLICIGIGVAAIIYGGMMLGRTNLAERNRDALGELEDADILAADMPEEVREEYLAAKHGSQGRTQKLIGSTCGTIMLVATIIALCWLFLGVPGVGREFFWLPWPLGGICCGIASMLIKTLHE